MKGAKQCCTKIETYKVDGYYFSSIPLEDICPIAG